MSETGNGGQAVKAVGSNNIMAEGDSMSTNAIVSKGGTGTPVQGVQVHTAQKGQVQMKKAYSEYVYWLRRYAKVNELSWEQSVNHLLALSDANPSDQKLFYHALLSYFECQALEGNCTHYFVTGNGMSDWFEKVAPPLDDAKFALLETTIHEATPQHAMSLRNAVIHFEGGGSPSWLVAITNRRPACSPASSPNEWVLLASSGANGGVLMVDKNGLATRGAAPEILRFLKMFSAFLCYIEAFPDCIKDGIPGNLKHPNHFKGRKCVSIGNGPAIGCGGHDSPVPHYRVGHLRYLQSPFYTHKRFTAVFVDGTFVKGKATTVHGFDKAA